MKKSRCYSGRMSMKELNNIRFVITALLSLVLGTVGFSQSTNARYYSLSKSEKYFIQNKGQVPDIIPDIKYVVSQNGLQIYFAPTGLVFHKVEMIRLKFRKSKIQEIEEAENLVSTLHDPKKKWKRVENSLFMNWQGCNPNAEIITEESPSTYFTYHGHSTDPDNPYDISLKSGTAIANAYKKIIYKNLYPQIDFEFTFPDDKEGIKYAVIIHPGANPDIVKMVYRESKKIQKDGEGNVVITSSFGDFIDHAPTTFNEAGNIIRSQFEVKDSIVSFNILDKYDKHKQLIIDPYITNPNMNVLNSAYDIDYDTSGNIYVYGGDGRGRNDYQVKKFDSTLTKMKWAYGGGFGSRQDRSFYYGDFGVDPFSQSVYICEGDFQGGARIIKLGPNGTKTGFYDGKGGIYELWRYAFNSCTRRSIIGGGGDFASYHIFSLDTNLQALNPVKLLPTNEPQHDICLLAIDKNNTVFASFARTNPIFSPTWNNCIVKAAVDSLTNPNIFIPNDNHDFGEVQNIAYVNNTAGNANGFNGIAVSPKWLYTYDGNLIQRWNKNTGALRSSTKLTGTAYQWGGIDVDECDNVYVGVKNQVIKYDSTFKQIAVIGSGKGNVYDVKLDPKRKKVYACGNQFVASFEVEMKDCNPIIITHKIDSICGAFTATVTVKGGTEPYTYKWLPSGGTSSVITGNTAGVYTVMVTDGGGLCLSPKVKIDTIRVKLGVGILSKTASKDVFCGAPGTASVTATNGSPTYTYKWSNGGTTSAISGLAPGLYSVTITDTRGCTKLDTVRVGAYGKVTVHAGPDSNLCIGSKIPRILIAKSNGGIEYIWSTGETTSSIIVLPSVTTTYTVIAKTNLCTDTSRATIYVNPLPVAKFSTLPVCFNTKPNVFKDLSIGNKNISNWSWDFGDGNKSTVQNPSHTYATSGTFTVTLIVKNNTGCMDTIRYPAVVNPIPVPNFSSTKVCKGDSSCFKDLSTISKGSIGGWSWNFGDPTSGANNTSLLRNPCHKFIGTGPFNVILTATSDSGCQNVTILPADIFPLPTAKIIPDSVCLNVASRIFDASTSSSAADPIVIWKWDLGDGTKSTLQNPSHIYPAAGAYTVHLVITTKAGCKDSTTNIVKVAQAPIANFSDSVRGCSPVDYTFKDLSVTQFGTIASWEWSFPGGRPGYSKLSNPTVHWDKPGVYDANLIVTSSFGCKDTLKRPMYINVYPWPKADFCVTPTIAPVTEPIFNFCDLWSSDVVKWQWDFGDKTTDTTNNPTHIYSNSLKNDFYKFKICIRVETKHGCWDTACHFVELIPEFVFYIPNTFTPGGDGFNEKFFGKSRGVKDYNIWIFDRWGNQIWDCHYQGKNTDWDDDSPLTKGDGLSSACQWDGRVKKGGMDMSGNSQELIQEDVYVWKVQLTDIFGKRHFYIGNVNVVK